MNEGMIKMKGYSGFDIIRTKNNIDDNKLEVIITSL